jgi:hypothetical protein
MESGVFKRVSVFVRLSDDLDSLDDSGVNNVFVWCDTWEEHSGNMQGTLREHGNIQGTCRAHSGNIQGTCRAHSGNIQGTFREHSGNIQETFRLS